MKYAILYIVLFLAAIWLAGNPFEWTQRIPGEYVRNNGLAGTDNWTIVWWVVLLCAVFEYMDSAGGMGYGTALTRLLLTAGFDPKQVVPLVMITEMVTGLVSGLIQKVLEIVQEATKATNAQEAVEKVQSDPVAREAAVSAIEDNWFQLIEAGGGGIEGARKADFEARARGDLLNSPSFWVALLLLPLVYMIVANVIGVIGIPLSDEVRSAISNGVVGLILGGLIGYYYGTTTSRNRT